MFIKALKAFYAPVIIAFIIFYLCCLIPTDDVPKVNFDFFGFLDKIVHYVMYLGFSGATAFNLLYISKGNTTRGNLLLWCILLPIIYGGVIELLQHYCYSPREGDWFDFLADVLGSLTAIPFIFWFKNYLQKKNYA